VSQRGKILPSKNVGSRTTSSSSAAQVGCTPVIRLFAQTLSKSWQCYLCQTSPFGSWMRTPHKLPMTVKSHITVSFSTRAAARSGRASMASGLCASIMGPRVCRRVRPTRLARGSRPPGDLRPQSILPGGAAIESPKISLGSGKTAAIMAVAEITGME
jgi:hypothetical protein